MLEWYLRGGANPPFFGGSGVPPGFGSSSTSGSSGGDPNPNVPPPPISPLNPGSAGGAPLIPRDPTIDRRVRRLTDLVSEIFNSLIVRGYIIKLPAHEWRIAPGTYVESRDPTAVDDTTRSVMIGDFWLNEQTETMWMAFDVSAGHAVWVQVLSSASPSGSFPPGPPGPTGPAGPAGATGPSGSSAIGNAISGSSLNEVLFVDSGGNLAQDASFQFQGSSGNLLYLVAASGNPLLGATNGAFQSFLSSNTFAAMLEDATNSATFCNGSYAAQFVGSGRTVTICSGTGAISYVAGVSGNWDTAPPTDMWVALDRIAAWIQAHGGGPLP